MAMYHMAMPPHYGGSHPPNIPPPMFPGPLLPPVNRSHAARSFDEASAHNVNTSSPMAGHHQLALYHQPQASIYINPYMGMAPSGPVLNMSAHHHHHQSHLPNMGYAPNQSVVTMQPVHPALSMGISQHPDRYMADHRQHLSADEELLEDMNALHLGYIETEDSPEKMKQREKLEDVILEYLSITPHTQKCIHPEVLEVLEQSADSPEFNAHKAACAFDALAQYAVNLISQPWRREFREIKLYNGFWVHQVASQLIGAESILELMGYVSTKLKGEGITTSYNSKNIRSSTYVLHGVLDADLISRLALDCMIAYCECQCMKKIREGVHEYGLNMSQILQFRKLYIGGVEVTIRHLLFTMRQQVHLARPSIKLDSPTDKQALPTSPPPVPARQSSSSLNSSVAVAAATSSYAVDQTKNKKRHGATTASRTNKHYDVVVVDSASKTNRSLSFNEASHSQPHPHLAVTGKEHGSSFPAPQTRSTDISAAAASSMLGQVPTARLIDLDSSLESVASKRGRQLLPKVVPHKSSNKPSNNILRTQPTSPQPHLSDEVLQKGTLDEHLEASLSLMKSPNPPFSSGQSDGNSIENWDFVYRGLEKKGYYKGGIGGERGGGDILQEIAKQSSQQDTRNVNLNNHTSKNRPMTINQALHQLSLKEKKEGARPTPERGLASSSSSSEGGGHSRHQRNSLYDNVSGGFETAIQYSDEYENPQPQPLRKINNAMRIDNKVRNNSGGGSGSRGTPPSSKTSSGSNAKEQCLPPAASQRTPGPKVNKGDNLPIEVEKSKSWSCVTCTFINNISRKSCDMCGKSKQPGHEGKPLTSGGKQCPFCTLINDRETESCSACGGLLEGSSTYI